MIGGAAWCEPHVPSLTVGVATYWPGRTLKIQGKFRFVVIEFPNFSVRSLRSREEIDRFLDKVLFITER
jgi:hypothetical protein